ncbi:MAG: potassium channel family protein [Alphaproteobacteria bacterium]|uniref:potassium channel family protein n=1 Tax=Maricaulis alexandrii TaxID=2570354 RepID=UPI0011080C81|nr:potassium channel family protein [Maricaulis alexandrii]MCR9267756.1 potassium channel family protein [Alphaproteobacteria bacterium]
MLQALVLSAIMVVVTTAIHLAGLTLLLGWTRQHRSEVDAPGHTLSLFLFILAIVIGVFLVHVVEIMAFAGVYMAIGEITSFETAVYFSASTFTTLGMGDIYLDSHWRLLVAMEGLIGFLMIGWSTAFLISLVGKLRTLEEVWFDRDRETEQDAD